MKKGGKEGESKKKEVTPKRVPERHLEFSNNKRLLRGRPGPTVRTPFPKRWIHVKKKA
ncbi:hypothetical protein GCM10025772_12430 [Ferrimonas gelatinilytica]|uniref:Uncharacterized protein n=1 Tax=Ferrimonas gelatinilytica TaxID=1255257 RepID=A0ABP9S2C0_9GAMM